MGEIDRRDDEREGERQATLHRLGVLTGVLNAALAFVGISARPLERSITSRSETPAVPWWRPGWSSGWGAT